MRLSEIKELLEGRLGATEFRASNATALLEYGELSKKRGAAISIRVEGDVDLLVTLEHVARACELRISEDLLPEELAYMADVLQLSDRVDFQSEELAQHISEFTDPEINGPFTSQQAKEILDEIRKGT